MLDFNFSGTIVEFFLDPSGYFMGVFDPYFPLFPSGLLILGALIMLCCPNDFQFTNLIAFLTAGMGLLFGMIVDGGERAYFHGMIGWSERAVLAQTFILFALFLSMLTILPMLRQSNASRKMAAEYFALMFFSAVGAIQMCMSRNLIALFLSLELLSLPLYVLCSLRRHDDRSREAGFKYFMLGAFAAGFFLMGAAYLYGATGSFGFAGLANGQGGFFLLGSSLLLVALSFKAAIFPFHSWLPDVYEGAPSPVTGFMASAVKMAVFALLITLVFQTGLFSDMAWTGPLKLLVIVSMTVANLAAMRQKSFKRMLAYSSIAHVAYALVALIASSGAAGDFAVRAVMFYVVTYGIASLGTFAAIAYLDNEEKTPFYLQKLDGLAKLQPFTALTLAIFLLSLAGVPPVAGFIGKFYLFGAAVKSSHWDLAIAGIINSLLSIYYYARPVVAMYMKTPSDMALASNRPSEVGWSQTVVLAVTAALTLLIGCVPYLLFRITGAL